MELSDLEGTHDFKDAVVVAHGEGKTVDGFCGAANWDSQADYLATEPTIDNSIKRN